MNNHLFVTYYRVSTDRQGQSGLGLEAQKQTVNEFLGVTGSQAVAEFIEVESGGKDDRPKLREALAACQRGKYTLLIAKLDRLARSVAFIANLMDSNIEFVACDMPHASRLLLHVMAAFAEHERQIIGERTKAALSAAKARGVKLGQNGSVLAKVRRAEALLHARSMQERLKVATALGATTTREMAKYLNDEGVPAREGGPWHPASVARVLRRLSGVDESCQIRDAIPPIGSPSENVRCC